MSVTRRDERDPAREPVNHRTEAERLLAVAADGAADWESIVARALVHATLAGPSTRTIEVVSRPPGVDQGWQDLLDAACDLLAHAGQPSRDRFSCVPTEYLDALRRQVDEATGAGQ